MKFKLDDIKDKAIGLAYDFQGKISEEISGLGEFVLDLVAYPIDLATLKILKLKHEDYCHPFEGRAAGQFYCGVSGRFLRHKYFATDFCKQGELDESRTRKKRFGHCYVGCNKTKQN